MSGGDSLSKVSFGASELPGYEGGDTSLPAVIVVQEWWGVTPIVKDQASLIRDKGFRVLIPDLYKGKIGVDAEEASHMMHSLDFKAALGELQQAVDYLKGSGSPKVAIIGFCMGGAISFAAAEHVTGLTAGSAFYGLPDPRLSTVDKAKVPMQAHFGALDTFKGFSDIETAKAAEAKMKDAGLSPEFHYYPGCGHAFLNGLTEEGREKISTIGQAKPPDSEVQEAFERLITFLTKHLK